MNLLLVDDEIAMLHIMEKAIDWKIINIMI